MRGTHARFNYGVIPALFYYPPSLTSEVIRERPLDLYI